MGRDVATELAGASNILLSAPSLSPLETTVCTESMAIADPSELNVLAITYSRDPDRWLADFRTHFGEDPAYLKIVSVNEMTRGAAVATVPSDAAVPGKQVVDTVESPYDLTGLGIQISEYLHDFEEVKWDSGGTDTTICFDSVTALLQFVDPQRAFRFLHLVTDRVSSYGATAHYHIHPQALDEQTVNTLGTLFDGVVTVGDDGVEDVSAR